MTKEKRKNDSKKEYLLKRRMKKRWKGAKSERGEVAREWE